MRVPADNPLTPEKVRLGKRLFFDVRLSGDGSTSCSGCHDPGHGYTVGAARPVGAYRVQQNRACPSLLNVAYQKEFFWEGGADNVEDAVSGIWRFILAPRGSGRPKVAEIAARLNDDPALRKEFRSAFGSDASAENVVKALASFLRTLVPTGAPWVRFYSGDEAALSATARQGYELFSAKARCSTCHTGVLLTDRLYHNIGAGQTTKDTEGRVAMTKDERDRGAFKTPTLLNVGRSAPYFHDNSTPTLEEAVDRMLSGGFPSAHLDPQLRPVTLTAAERAALLAFLRELDADPAKETW
jgi:cytochrome c peroxidase